MSDKGPKCQNTIKNLHQGPINVVKSTLNTILTAGKDGVINLFTHDLKKISSFATNYLDIISVDYSL